MKIAIYGSGGLGGYYGARLSDVGHAVHFIARGAHGAAMAADGLRVLSPLGDTHIHDVVVSDDPADFGEMDLIVAAVKTWQMPQVAEAMTPMVGPATRIVPFLNGVDAPSQLAAVHGAERVIGGLSRIFSLIEAPGIIRHFNASAYVQIGDHSGGVSASTEAIRQVFASAGVEAETSSNIAAELWKKLLLVSSWAGLGALSGFPLGVLRETPETRALVDLCIDEGLAVGNALGHNIDPDHRQVIWDFYDALPADVTASMMRDIRDGKPSELDAWNGAIVRFGEQCGVPTPTHRVLYHALLPTERRARGD